MAIARTNFRKTNFSHAAFSNSSLTAPSPLEPGSGLNTLAGLGRSSSSNAANLSIPQRQVNPNQFRGQWAGIITQPGITWRYEMRLRRTGGSRFRGVSVISAPGNPGIFGVMTLRGSVVNRSFLFKEVRITDQNPPLGFRWCLKGGRLRFSRSNGNAFLQGPWSDPGCNAGRVSIRKR